VYKKVGHHGLKYSGESSVIIRFGKTIDGAFYGYTTYAVSPETGERLLEFVPEKYRHGFEPSLIEVNVPNLPPHVDNEILSVLNFYVSTAGGETVFYSKPDHDVFVEKLPNQTDGAVYRAEDLMVSDSFVAKPGDVYALDIKQIHGVVNCSGLRRAYCLKSYVYNFQDVVRMFDE